GLKGCNDRFLYTGICSLEVGQRRGDTSGKDAKSNEACDDQAAELFAAADRFQVPQLMELCGNYLANSLTVDNLGHRLKLAARHNDSKLVVSGAIYLVLP